MQSNIVRRLVPLTAAATLALAAGQASAVEIEVLELGHRNTVKVAILGAQDLDLDNIKKRGLILGWRQPGHDGGYVQALRLRRARRDVNGDGYADAIALFRLSETDFQDLLAGNSVLVEVQGLHWDRGIARPFVAQTTVLGDDTPSSACHAVQNALAVTVGTRCIWTTADGSSYKPIDTQQLVDDLNSELTNIGLQIASTSAVVIEAYGGKGEGGANHDADTGCTAKGGSAGGPGYSQTVTTAGALPDLFVYPGGSASGNGGGGASTVVSSIDLTSLSSGQLDVTTSDDLVDFAILGIAGGGGGGGDGNLSDSDTECHHGGDGGAGGSAIASTSADASVAGADGSAHGTPGDGGNGSGGKGSPRGSNGLGGPGGAGYNAGVSGTGGGAFWNGWSTDDNAVYSPTAWTFGAGGAGNVQSGGGGGGFGGGGAANGANSSHRGGGGGGGSFAAQATVDANDLDSNLVYGRPAQSGPASQVVVTFALTPSDS